MAGVAQGRATRGRRRRAGHARLGEPSIIIGEPSIITPTIVETHRCQTAVLRVGHQYQQEKAQLQGGRAGTYPGLSPPCPQLYHKPQPCAAAGIIKHAQASAAVGTLPPSNTNAAQMDLPTHKARTACAAALRLGWPQRGCAPRNGLLRKAWRFLWGCAPQYGMLLTERVLLTQWAPLQRHKVQDQAKCGGSLVLQRQSLIVYGSAPWGMGPTGRCR
jgi:hypothetical protein